MSLLCLIKLKIDKMKKLLSIVMLGFTLVSFAQDKAISYNKLPKMSQQFINKYFGAKQVGSTVLDDDYFSKEYKVYLNNGTKVEFDGDGSWKEIDGHHKGLPTAFIPAKITTYVKRSFPNTKITKIEKDRNSYDIELSNGLDVEFDLNGNFNKIDD